MSSSSSSSLAAHQFHYEQQQNDDNLPNFNTSSYRPSSKRSAFRDSFLDSSSLSASGGPKEEGGLKGLIRRNIRYVVLVILIFVFITWMQNGFSKFLNRSQFNSGTQNTRCFPHPSKTESSPPPTFCLPKKDMKFKKFLWFLSDGLSSFYSQEIFEHYKDHAVIYSVDVPGPKFSHAIYTAYLTGQLPTNFKGSPIQSDHLIRSMVRSNYNLTYIGPEWSFLAILGEKNYKTFFGETGIYIRNEALTAGHTHGYPFFYETHVERNWFQNEILPTLVHSEGSLLTHSAIFDHAGHGEYRSPNGPNIKRLERLARRYAEDLNTLKRWIDDHPDYLLILSSDHGLDDISKGYVLHGYSTNGNEGYVMLYNPNLKPNRRRIDIVDVCSTVSHYLEGVDIPADNIGVSQVHYDDLAYETLALQQNVAQLLSTSKQRGVLSSAHASKGKEILDISVDPIADARPEFNQTFFKVKREAEDLKHSLYSLINPPWAKTLFHFIISIVMIALMVVRFTPRLVDYLLVISFVSGAAVIGFIIMMYSGLFINVLFCWDTWRGVFDSGAPIFIWQAGLVLCLFFLMMNIGTQRDLDNGQRHLIKRMSSLLFMNSLIDMAYFFLKNVFRQQWKYLFQIPFISIPLYMLLCYHLLSILGISNILWKCCCFCFCRRRGFSEEEKLERPRGVFLHFLISIILVCFVAFYELTIEEKSFFNVHELHFAYAWFLAGALLYIAYIFFFCTDDLHLVIIPISIYQFALSADVPHMRFLLVMFVMQYRNILAPLISMTAVGLYKERRTKPKLMPRSCPDALDALALQLDDNGVNEIMSIVTSGGITNRNNPKHRAALSKTYYSQLWNILPQALILLLINQPFFHFYVAIEEKLNIDAHPFAGGVGMQALDANPNFNGFQMGFEKYCPFVVYVFIMWYIFHRAAPAAGLIAGKRKAAEHNGSKMENNNNNSSSNVSPGSDGESTTISIEEAGVASGNLVDMENSVSPLRTTASSSVGIRHSHKDSTMMTATTATATAINETASLQRAGMTVGLEYQRYKEAMDFLAGMTCSILALFFNNTVWFLHLLLCFISNRHGFEQASVYFMLAGIITVSFFGLHTLSHYGGVRGFVVTVFRTVVVAMVKGGGDRRPVGSMRNEGVLAFFASLFYPETNDSKEK